LALVKIRNRDVLPTCGRPIMPVFIVVLLSAIGVRGQGSGARGQG
jgi:hypothetical protein